MKKKTATIEHDNIPRLTITLTDESVYLTRHGRTGEPTATYPVSAAGVAAAFNLFGASTGLLPPATLFWQSHLNRMRIGLWLEPAVRTIQLRTGKRLNALDVPMPGMVFVGDGLEYAIWAAERRPLAESDVLYHCPLPNVYDDGHICRGNVPFPAADVQTMAQAAALFFDSEFNHDLAGHGTIDRLKELNGKKAFPTSDLRPATTLGAMMAGKPNDVQFVDDEMDLDPYEYAYGETENDDDED